MYQLWSLMLLTVITLFLGTFFVQHAFTPDEIAEGGRLYQANCTGCHGSSGDQVQGVALMSGKFRRATNDDEVAGIIRKGVAGTAMQAFNLTEAQASRLVAYLRSFSPNATTTSAANAVALGDAVRGKQILEGKGNCLSCHRIGQNGSRVGPDLTGAGLPRPPAVFFLGFEPPPPPTPASIAALLQRDLLEPDAEISPANRTFRAVLKDGAVITGRLLNLDNFTYQLFDSKDRLLTLQRSEVREFTTLKSPMPSFRDRLTAPELSDLLAYLMTLKGQVQ